MSLVVSSYAKKADTGDFVVVLVEEPVSHDHESSLVESTSSAMPPLLFKSSDEVMPSAGNSNSTVHQLVFGVGFDQSG